MNQKLYIEYRVYFDHKTNQELLQKVAEAGQEKVYDLFDDNSDSDGNPVPSPHDVTYEIKLEAVAHICECSTESRDHEAGKCESKAFELYIRGDKLLWLCHRCRLSGDIMKDVAR